MSPTLRIPHLFGQRGMGMLGILFIIILIILLLIMGDLAFIFTSSECIDENIFSCLVGMIGEDDEEDQEGGVVATGVISGEYGGENRSVTVSLNIPLEGGAVTGNFSGDCDGNIKGTYAGGGGVINGTAKGSCAFVMPASGKFSGTVNVSSKTVPLNGSGSVPGFSGEGSLTLTY